MDCTPSQLSDKAGISLSYASMILSGDRTPPLKTALKIFDATGLALGPLKGLTQQEIEPLLKTAA